MLHRGVGGDGGLPPGLSLNRMSLRANAIHCLLFVHVCSLLVLEGTMKKMDSVIS